MTRTQRSPDERNGRRHLHKPRGDIRGTCNKVSKPVRSIGITSRLSCWSGGSLGALCKTLHRDPERRFAVVMGQAA